MTDEAFDAFRSQLRDRPLESPVNRALAAAEALARLPDRTRDEVVSSMRARLTQHPAISDPDVAIGDLLRSGRDVAGPVLGDPTVTALNEIIWRTDD